MNKDLHMESIRPTSFLQMTSPGVDPVEVSQLLSTIEYQNDLLKGFQTQLLTLLPVSHLLNTLQIGLCLSIPIMLSVTNQDHQFSALIDSGAAANVIHQDLVKQLNIPTIKCEPPIIVTAVDDGPIGKGCITHQTLSLQLRVGLFHTEEITFYVISSPQNPVILGCPWLSTHNPHFS